MGLDKVQGEHRQYRREDDDQALHERYKMAAIIEAKEGGVAIWNTHLTQDT
ncbi:hypothetical protein [Staphylococcus xylosus]|uniref:hypothetical protein n=1 Tax=Staphylococcus xylosus TaxID=1288 RepID=UPI00187BFC1E|nr:hypothetical protein [Staphylococcus xylosus]